MTRRMDRVNVLLREEISRILSTELSDPRLPSIVSVTNVEASADLKHAKVYISVLGDQTEKRNTLIALKSAAGYIHRTMGRSLKLKNIPLLTFQLDESIEKGTELLEVIRQVAPHPEPPEGA